MIVAPAHLNGFDHVYHLLLVTLTKGLFEFSATFNILNLVQAPVQVLFNCFPIC